MEDDRTPRAAIYARVSTEDQIKGTSLDGQVERCRRAADAAGWHVVEEFVDRGVSGALSSRPRLDALVRLVEDGSLDVVAITKLDRIARSLRHLLDLLELLERHHVTLVALDDPLDPSTASGRAMVQLRGVFAELERQLIRERTSEGQRSRVAAGGWPGGPAPYGYKAVDNPLGAGRVLVVDEAEAAVVRLGLQTHRSGGMHDRRGRGPAATPRNPAETCDPLDPLEPSPAPPGWPRAVRSMAVEAVGPTGSR